MIFLPTTPIQDFIVVGWLPVDFNFFVNLVPELVVEPIVADLFWLTEKISQ